MLSNISNLNRLYKVTAQIPAIPNKSSKESAKNLLAEFALENNFMLAYDKTDLPRLELKCTKGGTYRNTRGITENNRKRQKITKKISCPNKIRYKITAEGVYILQSQTDIEMHHNHPLTVENLCTIHWDTKGCLRKQFDYINVRKVNAFQYWQLSHDLKKKIGVISAGFVGLTLTISKLVIVWMLMTFASIALVKITRFRVPLIITGVVTFSRITAAALANTDAASNGTRPSDGKSMTISSKVSNGN